VVWGCSELSFYQAVLVAPVAVLVALVAVLVAFLRSFVISYFEIKCEFTIRITLGLRHKEFKFRRAR